MECPHSLYFFRSDVENFSFIDDYKGDKTAEELTEHPNPLLVMENEGDYFRASQTFETTEDYVVGPGIEIEAGSYVIVVREMVYTVVTPVGTENPANEGWYERTGSEGSYVYTRTADTSVDPNKTYCEGEPVYKFKNFGENIVNTLRDWHIVPLGRPVVNPPEQKLTTIDIPGANGILDISNSLTHYPVFNNRTGSMKFAMLVDETDWLTCYTKMLRFLQGNNVKMIMEDDPKYYYEGRVYVDNWDSKNDGTWSEVTIGYDLQPYRRSIRTSIDDWLWDPFNFETDVVTDTVFNAIRIDADDDWDVHDFTGLIDMMPVMPLFTVVTDDPTQPIQAQLYNSDLKYNWKDISLPSGESYVLYNCILCETTPESVVKMRFKGHGQVTMNFRSGRL